MVEVWETAQARWSFEFEAIQYVRLESTCVGKFRWADWRPWKHNSVGEPDVLPGTEVRIATVYWVCQHDGRLVKEITHERLFGAMKGDSVITNKESFARVEPSGYTMSDKDSKPMARTTTG